MCVCGLVTGKLLSSSAQFSFAKQNSLLSLPFGGQVILSICSAASVGNFNRVFLRFVVIFYIGCFLDFFSICVLVNKSLYDFSNF